MKKYIFNNQFRLSRNQKRIAAIFMLVSFLPTATFALPVAPQVINGTAAISTSGNAMTITNSANAIINWKGFSIGQNESTRFIQPSAASAVLNRITGGDPSKILGALQSNGKVLLINPNGILFGPGSRVDVNGLIASTLNITNQDFLAGKMNFTAGLTTGKVDNQGAITTPGGGQVYLIAPDVTNNGVITAPNGDILLAAGKEVLLVDKNSPEIAIVVSAPEHQALNLGTLVADAGRIGVYGGIVRQSGRISADSAVKEGGRIFLKSTRQTVLEPESSITADGIGSASGGRVVVWSDAYTQASGSISARGGANGGDGGFVETSGSYLNVIRTPDLSAPVGQCGTWLLDPYDIVIGASDVYNSNSGSNPITYTPTASTSSIAASTINTALDAGTSVIVNTTGGGGEPGDITVNTAITKAAGTDASLTLLADRSIVINAPVTATVGKLNVTLNAHYLNDVAVGNVSIQNNIATNGGNLVIGGGTNPLNFPAIGYGTTSPQEYGVYIDTSAQVTTAGGNISILGQGFNSSTTDADGISFWSGQISAGGGNITMIGKAGNNQTTSSSGVYIASQVNTTGAGTINIQGTGGVNTGTINRGISLAAGTITTVDGLLSLTGTGGNAPGFSNEGIFTNVASAVQSTGAGSIYINGTQGNSGSKGIDLPGLISTPSLEVVSSGSAIMSNTNHAVTIAAVISGAANSFTYESASGFTVGTVGGTTGITTNNGDITARGNSADANILVNGDVNAGTGNVQIGVVTGGTGAGSVAVASGKPVTGAGVSLWSFPDSGVINVDGTLTGNTSINLNAKGAINTGASGLVKSNTINLMTTTGYTGGIGSPGTPLKTSPLTPVSGTTAFSIGSPGTPSGVNILHNGIANIGTVLLATDAPFKVEAVGNLTVPAIATGASDLALISTSGVLTMAGSLSGTNIGLTTAADFSPSSSITATNSLSIDLTGTGAKLTLPASSNFTAPIVNVKADKMDLSAVSGSFGGAGSTVRLLPKAGGRPITLGTDTSDINADLELSTNELNKVTASILWVGDSQSGPLSIGAAIAPTGISALALGSGSTIGQAAAGTISVAALAIQALGDVDLTTATNLLSGTGDIAAAIGDATYQNKNFKFKNSGALNVSSVAGISGISTNINGVFDSGLPDGVISLISGGALSQSDDTTSLLSGKAVYLEGTTVNFSSVTAANKLNPTGVVAGKSTGGSFQYKSANPIFVTTVDGASGIQNTGTGGDIVLTSAGGGIAQDAILSTKNLAGGGGFTLSLTGNDNVVLQNPSNNVGNLSANLSTGTGSLSFMNSEHLTVTGSVVTNGNFINLEVPSTKTITVSGTVSAGTGINGVAKILGGGIVFNSGAVSNSEVIAIRSTAPTVGITLSGGVVGTSNTKNIDLTTDKLTLSAGTVMVGATAGNSIGIMPFTADTPIVLGTGATVGTLYITDTSDATFSAPDFGIGSAIMDIDRVKSGAISVDAAIARAGRLGLFTGAGVTQTAAGKITATALGVIAGGSVVLNTSTLPNVVTNLGIETATGNISFANSGALTITSMTGGLNDPNTITGLKSIVGGNITLSSSTGNITLASPIVTDTVSGIVTLQSPMASIIDANATGTTIIAKSLDASAYNGIGTIGVPLKTQVSNLKAVNSMGGDVSILNIGALTTDASTAVSCDVGNVTITAHSPLTIGAGGVTAGGNVTLTAGSSGTGVTTDNLTVNGPVTSSNGNIVLTAGNSISGAGVLTASSGTITKTANLNPPAVVEAPPPPTVDQCTLNPTLSGCTAVLPTLDICTATPTAPGCTAVLPTVATCTTEPTLPGCSTVLPTLDICTTTPTTLGCTAVLPAITTCTTDPKLPGCSTVLPTLDICTATPTAPGCTAVLPTVATCTTDPTLPGCSTVLPTLTTCTATPTAPGCTAVLPALAICTATPTAPGCSAVLPAIASCTTDPTLPGCSTVLPTLAICTTTPTAPGCTAVLPALAICTTTPTAPGCSAVLPAIASCTTDPTLPGCSTVLPTLAICTATPSAPGCTAVLPTLAICTTTPTAPGCAVVLPPQEQKELIGGASSVITAIDSANNTPVAPAGLLLVALSPQADSAPPPPPPPPPTQEQPPAGGDQNGGKAGGNTSDTKDQPTDGANNNDGKDKATGDTNGDNKKDGDSEKDKEKDKDKDKDKKKDEQEQQPADGDKKDDKPKKNFCN